LASCGNRSFWEGLCLWNGLVSFFICKKSAGISAFELYAANFPDRPIKGKGKAVPLQAWSGPEGSRNLRFPDFMKTAQDGGKVVNLTHRPSLPPGNTPGTHFC
jgi:hypothetical protein